MKMDLDYQNISVHENMNMREESCKKDIPFRISIENVNPFIKKSINYIKIHEE